MRLHFAVLCMTTVTALHAADPVIVDVRRERVLVPVSFQGQIPGAYGSLWTVELTGYNDSTKHVEVGPFGPCAITCPFPPATGKTTFSLDLGNSWIPAGGEFFYVERPENEKVHFSLRTRDLTRQSSTWGTEIPIVRETEIPEGPVHLVDVPIQHGFRSSLRIYEMGDGLLMTSGAIVRVVDLETRSLLLEKTVTLSTNGGPPTDIPAQVMLADFGSEIAGFEGRVRIEVHPTLDGSRLWAFVSVTHNDTQHVTNVTPQ